MLEDHVSAKVTRKRLYSSPAANDVDDFSAWLHAKGYKKRLLFRMPQKGRVVHAVQIGDQTRPSWLPVELLLRERAGGRHIVSGEADKSAEVRLGFLRLNADHRHLQPSSVRLDNGLQDAALDPRR
jgi:hypothetical protein